MSWSDEGEPEKANPTQPALESTSPLEWVIAAIGGLLVVAAIAYMVVFAAAEPKRPPTVTLSVTSVTTTPGGYLVSFRAANAGGATAAGLQVSGELREGGAVVETSAVTIDYLPQQSEREGGLVFTRDPEDLTLSLRVEGYSEP
ncbi:TIGR02588 family protein [Phenylobacterium sp.]|uniref:TIGR02588 family protein n=1 Tax=Phenylobacterium sp. TaxID=1871053 RepID=UPI004035030A